MKKVIILLPLLIVYTYSVSVVAGKYMNKANSKLSHHEVMSLCTQHEEDAELIMYVRQNSDSKVHEIMEISGDDERITELALKAYEINKYDDQTKRDEATESFKVNEALLCHKRFLNKDK